MKVDFLIIGAGLAGLVLHRSLSKRFRTVVIDPKPGGWKIGEANVPEMFNNPVLGEVLDKVKALPSCAPKNGSLFIGEDSAALYPIVSNGNAAVHVARDELEQLFLREWQTPVAIESVKSIDLASRRVITDRTEYEVAGQIIDCSGAAMLVARTLNEVRPLWPIHSTWRYYDVLGDDPDRFWRHLQDTGRSSLSIDIPKLRLLPVAPDWQPGEATALTRVRDGEWMWQIPLFGKKVLSVGIVSRHGEVTEAALDEAVERHRLRNFTLRPRPAGPYPYGIVHRRSGFALAAKQAATMDYILVGDAFMFVDPVYSVGTSLAVNKALEVAALLNAGPWTEEKRAKFCRRYDRLLQRRIEAFGSWYSEGQLFTADTTRRVQRYFPEMTPFQAGISWQYAQVVAATLQLTTAVRTAYGERVSPERPEDVFANRPDAR